MSLAEEPGPSSRAGFRAAPVIGPTRMMIP